MIKISSHEKELSNKNVFSCLLNTVNEGAEVTLGGRLFHARFCSKITRSEMENLVRVAMVVIRYTTDMLNSC